MCYLPDNSNYKLQTQTTFKNNNPISKPGVSVHSRYDYTSRKYNYNNYQKPLHSTEDYKIPSPREDILFVTFIGGGDPRNLIVEIESKVIVCVI